MNKKQNFNHLSSNIYGNDVYIFQEKLQKKRPESKNMQSGFPFIII